MKRHLITSLLVAGAFLACTSVSALALTFDSSNSPIYVGGTYSGINLNPIADFELVGNQLQLTLTNSGAAATSIPDILVGFFFTVNGAQITSAASANMPLGSNLLNAPSGSLNTAGPLNVADYWAYGTGTNFGYTGYTNGVGAAGLGLSWTPISGGAQSNINGGDYGLVNGLASGNHVNDSPVIDNQVVFLFNIPAGFSLDEITGAAFQYGTTLASAPVPEPGTLLLLGGGLLGLAAYSRKRTKRS